MPSNVATADRISYLRPMQIVPQSVTLAMLVACGDPSPVFDAAPVGPDACAPAAPHLVYLNRGGGTFIKGAVDDSSTNVSTMIAADVTLPPPSVDDVDWIRFVECVGSKFAAFAVEFTEQDPGTAAHTQLVVIDDAAQIGAPPGFYNWFTRTCGVVERAIPFVMWSAPAVDRCWLAAQVVGMSFGLETTAGCTDVMSSSVCGSSEDKTFVDGGLCQPNIHCFCGPDGASSRTRLTEQVGSSCR
jgi:hypothetical protein